MHPHVQCSQVSADKQASNDASRMHARTHTCCSECAARAPEIKDGNSTGNHLMPCHNTHTHKHTSKHITFVVARWANICLVYWSQRQQIMKPHLADSAKRYDGRKGNLRCKHEQRRLYDPGFVQMSWLSRARACVDGYTFCECTLRWTSHMWPACVRAQSYGVRINACSKRWKCNTAETNGTNHCCNWCSSFALIASDMHAKYSASVGIQHV